MKKTIISLFMLCCISYTTSMATSILPSGNGTIQTLVLNCHTIDHSVVNDEHPRVPVRVPIIYFDLDSNSLYFENPCYECTLELVIPDTDTVVYTYSIPDGDDTVQLPNNLSGTYELHIHRGNYCFWGEIEL